MFVFATSMIYLTYLQWAAMASYDDAECNTQRSSGLSIFFQMSLGFIFCLATIWSIATASVSDNPKDQERISVGQDIIAEENVESTDPEANYFPVTLPTLIFQIVLLIASLYYGMLFSNWGWMKTDEVFDVEYVNTTFTFWVKLISTWVTLALFVVSFTLNICCPDRVL